jgi:tRNA pseudouridine65 synthase
MENMEILFEDDYLIAVNKPPGLFVHRTSLDPLANEFVLQKVRDMTGHRVYPVHRLDRKTSGVLLLAKSTEIHKKLSILWAERNVDKKYLAIVRGYTDTTGTIDYPLRSEKGKIQEAVTHYTTLKQSELHIPMGKFPTVRYSLVELEPVTGRMHQLRRHMSHIFHPIIGDRPHGCNKQNKFFKDKFDMTTLMLHAESLCFTHPETQNRVKIQAHPHEEFKRMLTQLELLNP